MENGTQITLLELDPNLYQRQNVTVSDFRARLSALRDIEEDLKILEELYSLKSCGLLKKDTLKYYSLKMSPDCLTMRGGVTFEVIIETMAELGYFVEWQVCNSKYFGVPQNRERVFIIGHLGTGHGREVFPVGVHDRPADELQGQRNNNRMISNTLDTRIKGNTRGTYPIIGGGILKVNGYHKV